MLLKSGCILHAAKYGHVYGFSITSRQLIKENVVCILGIEKSLMNPEKLSKLQAQVRIGGKARIAKYNCFYIMPLCFN